MPQIKPQKQKNPSMNDNSNSLSFLTKGSQVEVTSDEDGFTGAWFVATVIHPPPSISTPNNLVYVEYHHLFQTDSTSSTPTRLREYANVAYVRPSPQPTPLDSVRFQLNDVVDAFCRDGWWTGVVSNVLDNDYFEIKFQNTTDHILVHISDLRVHRKWVAGKWVLPQNQRTAGLMFDVGKKVEVSFEKETLRDVWFPATVIKNSVNNSFLVEYQQPGNGDEAVLHKVTVDYLHIRPTPPHLRDKNFVLLEKVDAYYDFGWWSGVITKELADNRYNVFFKHTKKEREFVYSKVRPHMEWKGGNWFNTSQGDTDARTLMDKQSDQTSPNITRQSTVETSLMKTIKQPTNLDNNDKNSLPFKRSTDEIMLHDELSKKTDESSAGQSKSEGFDSEISGINDQSFGKTENLSHGKKVRGKRGKSTELKTPTSDSSRKKEKLSNDFSLPVVSIKTRAREIAEKTDFTKDFTHHVIMGLECNRMKISQGKLLQKLPDEKLPYAAESDSKQPDVPLATFHVPLAPSNFPLTSLTMGGSEIDAASVAPKRKRGRPPKSQAKILKDLVAVEVDHENEGVHPCIVSLVEDDPMEEIGLVVEEKPEVGEQDDDPTSKDEILIENPVQGLHVQRGTKKYSSKKGSQGKKRTISVNTTEASNQDSQDAPKEKGSAVLEKDSTTKSPEPSVGKSLTTMSDDQPLSSWFDGVHTPMTVDAPDATMEQSSSQLQIVACDMDLPFVRSTPLWKTIESMEVFQKIPQRPHFRPLLEDVKDYAREGLAIGKMVTFTNVVAKVCGLRFDDPVSMIEDCLEILVELEPYGFEVEVIRERLSELLSLKDKQTVLEEESKEAVEKVEENKMQRKKIVEEIEEFDRQFRELEKKRKQIMLKKEKNNSEIVVMKATVEKMEKEMKKIGVEFDRLAAASL